MLWDKNTEWSVIVQLFKKNVSCAAHCVLSKVEFCLALQYEQCIHLSR